YLLPPYFLLAGHVEVDPDSHDDRRSPGLGRFAASRLGRLSGGDADPRDDAVVLKSFAGSPLQGYVVLVAALAAKHKLGELALPPARFNFWLREEETEAGRLILRLPLPGEGAGVLPNIDPLFGIHLGLPGYQVDRGQLDLFPQGKPTHDLVRG